MVVFPCAKINLGLNVVNRRSDGYHDIETVFHAIPLHDALEVKLMDENFPSERPCDIKITGNAIDCDEKDNLVIKAYNLLAKDYVLPRIHAHLYKHIPMKAGLGGGSSDGAFMIKLLDERLRLNMGMAKMERYASMLGADCAFFVSATPSFAHGIGDMLEPVDSIGGNLRGYHIVIVKPDVEVSTAKAYGNIVPSKPQKCCRDIVRQPIETWREELSNDFEKPVFKLHPILRDIKETLYGLGAVYASMSGSGSAMYAIFKDVPPAMPDHFKKMFVCTMKL